jgi:hypothetical protein
MTMSCPPQLQTDGTCLGFRMEKFLLRSAPPLGLSLSTHYQSHPSQDLEHVLLCAMGKDAQHRELPASRPTSVSFPPSLSPSFPSSLPFFFHPFLTVSHCVAQTGLELKILLHLLSARITGMYHQAQWKGNFLLGTSVLGELPGQARWRNRSNLIPLRREGENSRRWMSERNWATSAYFSLQEIHKRGSDWE